MSASLPVDPLPALDALPGIRAAFLTRLPGIDGATDRATALARLEAPHAALLAQLGFSLPALAEQIHGDLVTPITSRPLSPVAAADGLATATPGLTLGIYVADCAAIYRRTCPSSTSFLSSASGAARPCARLSSNGPG